MIVGSSITSSIVPHVVGGCSLTLSNDVFCFLTKTECRCIYKNNAEQVSRSQPAHPGARVAGWNDAVKQYA